MGFRCWLEEQQDAKIVDTNDVPEDDDRTFQHAAASLGNGTAMGYHVCNDPGRALTALRASQDIYEIYGAEHDDDELGPGLSVSIVPQLWMGRATSKWDFMQRLSDDDRKRISQAILASPMMDRYRLTQSEIDRAKQWLGYWIADPKHDYVLPFLADQPYCVPVWKPEFLEPLGIQAGTQPKQIEVVFRGKFVDLTDQRSDWRPYRSQGLDGAFQRGGFTTTGQLCIWRKRAIVSFNGERI